MKSDIEIARSIKLKEISVVAQQYDIPTDQIEHYGRYIAKVPLKLIDEEEKTISFNIIASITPGMSIKAIPLFYKNINQNYNYGIMGGKLPVCSWSSDVYLNWLTQNGLNNALNIATNTMGTAVSMASGNMIGSMNGLVGIYDALHQFTLADMTPNQAKGNTNAGDVNFSFQYDGGFTIYHMSIKDEYAKVVDDYFSMFGYKVNNVKRPNITGRRNWNFVKTIDCNILGDIPQQSIQEIKDMFNNGVTLWHNPSTFLDYSQDNSII